MPLTYAPDADPTTPGILTNCNALPSKQDTYLGVPVPTTVKASTIAASTYITTLFEEYNVATPTTAKVHFNDGAGNIDNVTWTAGGSLTHNTPGSPATFTASPVRFAQFGSVVIATTSTDGMKDVSSGSGIAAATLKPAIIVTVGGHLMALNYVDSGANSIPDGWACSKIYDHTDWSFTVATNSYYGRLLDGQGAIVAGASLGGYCVALKESSLHVGEFIGPPIGWAWRRVGGFTGAFDQESTVCTEREVYYLDPVNQDVMAFDGANVRSIGAGVRKTLWSQVATSKVFGCYDRLGSRVVWFTFGGSPATAFCYSTITGKWSRITLSNFTAKGGWCGLRRPIIATGMASTEAGMAVIGSDGTNLITIAGSTYVFTATLWKVGTQRAMTTIRRVWPKLLNIVSSASTLTCVLTESTHPGGTYISAGDTVTATSVAQPRFDFVKTARYIGMAIHDTNDQENPSSQQINLADVEIDSVESGLE